MADEELEASSAVTMLKKSGHNKLQQNQLQLDLPYWTNGAMGTHTHTHTQNENLDSQDLDSRAHTYTYVHTHI